MLQSSQRRCLQVVLVAGDLCMQAVELMLRPRCSRHWLVSAQCSALTKLAVLTQIQTSWTVGNDVVLIKTGGLEAVVPSGVVEGESGILAGEGERGGDGGRKVEGGRGRGRKRERGRLEYPSGSQDTRGALGGPP